MSILSGFFKTKRYRKTTDGYKLESNWTSGNTVELDDGNTVQNNLGAIKGITTSTSVAEEGYAADATTIAALNTTVDELNNSLNNDFVTNAYKNKILIEQENVNLLSGALTMNETRLVYLGSAINSPIVSNGKALHKMYYTNSTYFTNIVILFVLDSSETWCNYYHSATGQWTGWVKS